MLSVDQLTVTVGDVPLLAGVSFNLQQGKMLCIIGESGSGKTTLLKCLQGLMPLVSGTVHFTPEGAADTTSIQPGDVFLGLPETSWVMQNPLAALNPHQRVGEAISEGLYTLRLPKAQVVQRVDAALEEVELSATLKDRYPHQLSIGQAQRVCLARALISRPKLILFDEPLSALDAVVQKQIGRTIETIRKTHGLTSIFVTHDLGFAEAYGDDILLLKQGCVEAYQPADAFFADPASDYGVELIEAARTLGALSQTEEALAIARRARA